MSPPKDPVKYEEWLRNVTKANQKKAQDPEWQHKNKEGNQNKNKDFYKNPKYRSKRKEISQKLAQDLEWQRKQKEGAQRRSQDPEWQRKRKEAGKKLAQDPKWQHKQKEAGKKRAHDPEWQHKQKEGAQKNAKNPRWIYNHKERAQKLAQDPEWRRKNKKSLQKLHQNSEYQCKQQEARIGGFWYGNTRYGDPLTYCELWCPDLWQRIDEAQNYQSILSGKTKFDNGDRALSHHHIYWQPKACCKWDEDAQGYYAWIDIGTPKKPNRVKHYILGDPNKFVLLTAREHGMIARDKLKWIKIFEELIETKLGGVCYLPKVEQTSEPFLTSKFNI